MTGMGHTEGTSRMDDKALFHDLSSEFKDIPYNNSLGHIFVFCSFLNFSFLIKGFLSGIFFLI